MPTLARPSLTAQDVTDDGLLNEDVSLGVLSERLVSALLPTTSPATVDEQLKEEAKRVTSADPPERVAVGVLDDALRRELVSIGILTESDLVCDGLLPSGAYD